MQNPFAQAIKQHADLPEDAQKQAGKAIAGAMDDEYEQFIKTLLNLLQTKEIDLNDTKSFLNRSVYDALSDTEREQIDLALINLGQELNRIAEFRLSKDTPDSSPQLQTMILTFLDMKDRVEQKAGDVFKF